MGPKANVDGRGTLALLWAVRERCDAGARERLVELHLPLVRRLARRFVRRGERLEDLVQVGSVGLLEAIDRFDPARGGDFAAFAVPTITGEIRRHLRDRCGVVRLPRRLVELRSCVPPARRTLTQSLGRAPTIAELAEAVGAAEQEVELAADERAVVVALPPPDTLRDALAVDGGYVEREDHIALAAALRTLGARERRILLLRFFAGQSQAEIGRQVGLSQIQVSRLLRLSLDALRAALEGEPLRPGTGRTAA